MNLRVLLFLGVLVSGAAAVPADTRITYTIEGDDLALESILIRDGKLRMTLRGGPFWMLYDSSQDRIYNVYDSTKEVQILDTVHFREMQEELKHWQDEWARLFFEYEQQVRELDARFPDFGQRLRTAGRSLPSTLAKVRRIAKEAGRTSPRIREELEKELGKMPSDQEMQEVYDWLAEYEKYDSRHEMLIAESRKQYRWLVDNTMMRSRRSTGKRQSLAGYDCEQVEYTTSNEAHAKPFRLKETCEIPLETLAIPPEDRAVLHEMQELDRAMAKQFDTATIIPPALAEHLGIESDVEMNLSATAEGGFPIQTRYFGEHFYRETGRTPPPPTTATLASIDVGEATDPGLFEVPQGYSEKTLQSDLAPMRELLAKVEAMKRDLERRYREGANR